MFKDVYTVRYVYCVLLLSFFSAGGRLDADERYHMFISEQLASKLSLTVADK